MKTLLTVLAFLHIFTRQQTHGRQSCVRANYSSCCTQPGYLCNTGTGGCFCDRACHINNDCCADIHLICPESNTTNVTTNVDTTTVTVTVPISQSPTTHHDHDTSPTHTGAAEATSESVTVLHQADTEQAIIIDTNSSSSTMADKSSQAVTLREAVAWALLSLMTLLLFIGTLSVVTIIILLRIQKQRQKQDSTVTAEAPAYEMDGNPCYESSKIDTTYGANIYEPIETESIQYL